jgi:hypothetical protein
MLYVCVSESSEIANVAITAAAALSDSLLPDEDIEKRKQLGTNVCRSVPQLKKVIPVSLNTRLLI